MIIFLDIDEVVATSKSYDLYPADYLDRECMQALNYVVESLNAKVVISSSWRIEGLENLRRKFKDAKFRGEIIDITPLNMDIGRGEQIKQWIDDNKYKGKYIILDDEQFNIAEVHPKEKFWYIQNGFSRSGLTMKLAYKISLLNRGKR